jgi:hypothetical protein
VADWYVSSAAYSAIAAFQATHAYIIGDIIRPTAAANKAKYAFRCTTAGTTAGSEPSWAATNNATTTSGTAVFTNVAGQSTYFWAAAAGDIPSIVVARTAANDRVFVSSDHAETQTVGSIYGNNAVTSYGVTQLLCVNRGGSTPPVAADMTTGATVTVSSGTLTFEATTDNFHYGISYISTSGNIIFNSFGFKKTYLQNCQIYLNTTTTSARITSGGTGTAFLDNTTIRFGSTSQLITANANGSMSLDWINTPSAIAGSTFPSVLFQGPSAGLTGHLSVTARGVDFSAITGSLVRNADSVGKFLFDSCQIAASVTRFTTTSIANSGDLVELVNCYDSTKIFSESYSPFGVLTTETTITLSGGATDDVGTFSHKMVSNANADKFAGTLNGFWLDVENTTTGSSKTATVEIISSTALNNDEIALYLQYEGTSGSSVASFANSFIATPLTTAAAVTSSSATWNSSPSTPQKQKLQVTFTPRQAGRVRGQVRLGKASATVYYDPQIIIT